MKKPQKLSRGYVHFRNRAREAMDRAYSLGIAEHSLRGFGVKTRGK